MAMLQIVYQTSDRLLVIRRGPVEVSTVNSVIIKADACWLGKLGLTSISCALSIANYNRTLLYCKVISLDTRVSSVTKCKGVVTVGG